MDDHPKEGLAAACQPQQPFLEVRGVDDSSVHPSLAPVCFFMEPFVWDYAQKNGNTIAATLFATKLFSAMWPPLMSVGPQG